MKIFKTTMALVLAALLQACSAGDALDIEVEKLLARMTLDEKIGQLNQIIPSDGEITGPMGESISCEEAVRNGWCGSMQGLKKPSDFIRYQHIAVDSSRLGIPLLFGYDIIHGCRTIFPENLASSCSWDLEEIRNSARIAAAEASALGISWTFSPMCDISADPRWGRVSEGAGEDPYLGARISEAIVRGYQGDDLADPATIMACVKHFAAYGAPEGGRDYNTVDMSMRMFKDRYLPPYKSAIEAGAGTVMSSFNDFDAIPVSGNKELLRGVLRDELGFKGFVVSDWGSIHELVMHRVAADDKEAAYLAVKAGVNIDMVCGTYISTLKSLCEEGRIKEKEIDELVRPVLKAKFKLGLFDNPYLYGGEGREDEFCTEEYLEASRRLARKSMVLLKNDDGVLPMKTGSKIALIGPFADNGLQMLGSWKAMGEASRCVTFLKGLKERFGESEIIYEEGCTTREAVPGGVDKAVAAARRSDVVLITLGIPESGESTSLSSISIPDCQKDLLEAVCATHKPVVILLVTGRAVDLSEESELADAILVTWKPGTMAGPALADLLSGDFAPSGRLTASFPLNVGQIPFRYNFKSTGRPLMDPMSPVLFTSTYLYTPHVPRYAFGYGLSYTDFEYSDLVVETPEVREGEDICLKVTVKNTGGYDAEETVQVYVQDVVASTTRPVRELKAFAKVFLKAGESREVGLAIRYEDLAFCTAEDVFAVEPGDFKVFVGHDSGAQLESRFAVR